jgi:citrate lyase subunit beta/citryl-CoA lyase
MSAALGPRRSCLYMPGANAKALEKGRSLPADVLILTSTPNSSLP